MSEYTIIGCGDIGLRVARKLRAQNHSVERLLILWMASLPLKVKGSSDCRQF